MQGAADLLVPSDDRIELALTGHFIEVPGVFVKCVELCFLGLALHRLPFAQFTDRRGEALFRQSRILQDLRGLVAALQDRQQEMLRGDELIPESLQQRTGPQECLIGLATQRLGRFRIRLRQAIHQLFQLRVNQCEADVVLFKQVFYRRILLPQQPHQQMLRFNVRIPMVECLLLCLLHHFLCPDRIIA